LGITIAVAGKGGTGKTTLCGLIIRNLKARGKKPILAVDADANANLNQVLGVEVESSIGSLREETLREIDNLPAGIPKETYLEYKIQEILVEADGFDLLVMGRPEGAGCYCYVNNILRRYVDSLSDNYPYIVIDNEAGMEHLSRRTTKGVDFLIVTSDVTLRGVETAKRIANLAQELNLGIGKTYFVLNRLSETKIPASIKEKIAREKLDLLGTIPEDKSIFKNDLAGKSAFELPEESEALVAVKKMADKLLERK